MDARWRIFQMRRVIVIVAYLGDPSRQVQILTSRAIFNHGKDKMVSRVSHKHYSGGFKRHFRNQFTNSGGNVCSIRTDELMAFVV